jgi:nucleotide-binding universal stress UspA family protein
MNKPIQNIMVYIDGSEGSITAAQYALCLARSVGATLKAFYVINTKALNELVKARIFLKEEQMNYEQDLKADAERYLNHVRDLAQQKGIPMKTESAMGNVHQEILNRIKDEEIDLFVIGELSHIRSRRDEFYDETERAMRAVACSVLIVKDEERVWEMYNALE